MIKVNVLGSCVSRVSLLDGITDETGIADDRLEIAYNLDKQNVVCATYPPAFTRDEVENIVDIDVHEKYAIRSLQQNLNKDTMDLLKNSVGDYVITDFMDMHMAHAKYRDTYFATQALEFYRTNLGEKYKQDIEMVRFLELPEEKWLYRVDQFWDEMMEKYDGDHIILNRFRSNSYYLATDGCVREIPWDRFHGPSHPIPELNEATRRLENHIIERYNPWVIDLSKYFMGDENVWENLQGAHFEREFYRETMDAVREIIFQDGSGNWGTGVGEMLHKKCFDKPRFFQEKRRMLQDEAGYKLDIDDAIKSLESFRNVGDMLWVNILDKLYMRRLDDARVIEYVDRYMNEAKGII